MGLVLALTGTPVRSGNYTWYPVTAPSGKRGYVRGDCVMECDANGNAAGADATPDPSVTTSPASSYGYAMVTKKSTNLRKTAAGAVHRHIGKGFGVAHDGHGDHDQGLHVVPHQCRRQNRLCARRLLPSSSLPRRRPAIWRATAYRRRTTITAITAQPRSPRT